MSSVPVPYAGALDTGSRPRGQIKEHKKARSFDRAQVSRDVN